MLEVSKLSRSYGDFLAVDDVSFSIRPGEIVGLLGHNGAGKTTIMKMLSGYLEPDQGSITIEGIDLVRQPKRVQRLLGYLPENLPVYPEMAVADYLDYAACLKGLNGDLRSAEIRRVLNDTAISDRVLAPISTLSRGYKQRVGVAQAILGKPRLLILDEPTNGLDPTQTEHMRTLIRDMARQATVILSTHIMQEVEALCDRVLIVNAGKLVIDEQLASLKVSNQLAVVTDMALSTLQQMLAGMSGFASVQRDAQQRMAADGWQRYLVQLQADIDTCDGGALLAAAIIGAGGRIATLQPVLRNLETLFREVSEGAYPGHENLAAKEDVQHAA